MRKILLLLAVVSVTVRSLAWNHTGHKIVAELTWRELSSGKRHALSSLLQQHPHYALLLATNVPAGVDTNEWAFLNAAVWPDMVRPARGGGLEKPDNITKYHHSAWHYINIPFVPPSDAGHLSATNFTTPPTNILSALSNSMAELKDQHLAAPDKAVSLCWVLHLVGDLHQPLHAAMLLSDAYPHGDQGGNALAVADDSQIPLNLHSFWDQLLESGDSYELISTITDNIANAPQYSVRNLPEYKDHKTIRAWADESYAAAVAFAYAEGHLKFADWRDFGAGKITANEVPRLKSTYILNANDVARRRVSLSGQRLADILKGAF